MSETFTITVEPLEREVECRSDQPILDACLRAGVWLPHACTHGTCGTCKVEVLDGDVEHNDASDFALMEFERNEGKTLTCVATPGSDVTIEADIEVEEGVVHHPVEDFTGTLVSIDDIARETRRLLIDLDHGDDVQPRAVRDDRGAGQRRHPDLLDGQPARRAGPHRAADPADPGRAGTDGWIFKTLAVGRHAAALRTVRPVLPPRGPRPNRRSSSAAARGWRR